MAESSDTMNIIVRLRDQASKSVKGLSKQIRLLPTATKAASRGFDNLKTRIASVRSSIFGLQGVIAGLGVALTARSFLNVAKTFETLGVQLETIQGSSEKAEKSLKWIADFTATTPYELEEVAGAFVRLEAYGIDATKWMQVLGDTASSMGKGIMQAVEMFADAMTGEFERIKEFGVKARVQGDQVTFAWKQHGKAMTITADKTADGITGALGTIFQRFKGGMEKQSRTWSGMMSNLMDQWTMFQKSIMDAGVFEALKNSLKGVLEHFQNWVETNREFIRQNVPVYIEKIKSVINKIWFIVKRLKDLYDELPGDVVGIAGYGILGRIIFGGKKGLLFGLAYGVGKAMGAMGDEVGTELERLEKRAESLRTAIGDNINIEPGKVTYIDDLIQKLKTVEDKIKILKAEALKKIPLDEFLGVVDIPEKTEVEPIRAKPIKPVSAAVLAAELSEFKSAQQTMLMTLEGFYKDGLVDFDNYWTERRSMLWENYEKEKQILERRIAAADPSKPDKLRALNAQLFAIEQQHARNLMQLDLDVEANRKDIADKKLVVARALADIEERARIGNREGLTAQFQSEMAELQKRQEEETKLMEDAVKNRNATVEQLNAAHRGHEIEKEKLLADQKKRLMDATLASAQESLGFMSEAFGDMYEATGKKHKSWAKAQRATQIAMAIISTYQSAIRAYNATVEIPVVGPYLAPIAAAAAVAAGMAKVAAMRAQPLGRGGMVEGSSPTTTSDNIPISATAGEFMQPVSAVRKYGLGAMEAIRSGRVPAEVLSTYNLRGFRAPSGRRLAEGGVPQAGGRPSTSAAQQDPGITIVNVIDPNEFDAYLASPSGEAAVLNVISSNKDRVQRVGSR